MSIIRPIVEIFQDFAAASVNVVTPQLNVCLVGPCYQIEDYPTDKANLLLTTIGSQTTAASGSASAGTTISPTTVPHLTSGAVVDNSSAVLYVDAGFAEVARGSDGAITANQNTLTSASATFTSTAKVGDRLVISGVDGASLTIAKTVLSVTSATVLTLTTNFATSGTDISGNPYSGITLTLTGLKYRLERPLSSVQVDASSSVTCASNQVSTGSAVKVLANGSPAVVTYGTIYAGYRALRTDLSAAVTSITSPTDITNLLGIVDERNPLAAAATVALANASSTIQVLGISGDNLNGASDTLTQHTTASGVVNMQSNVYCVVPLTTDISTITMWKNYVVSVSAPTTSKFRIVIGSGTLPVTQQISPASGTSTGTVETNDGTHRNLLDNTATFITSGVQVNDNVVISAVSYPVTAILSENRVTLLGQPSTGAATYSIQRTLTKDQQVTSLSAVTAALKNSRCTMIWPDSCSVSGVKNNLTGVQSNQSGYYVAAAVGGMVAGLPPQQGLTYIGIAGISRVFHSSNYFSDAQIDSLSAAGWYVVLQDSPLADPYSIHELTTDPTTLESSELMVVKNFDYVSLTYKNAFTGFLGQYNIVNETTDLLTTAFNAVTATLQSQRLPKIGAPLISATLSSIAPFAGSKDRIEIYASVQIPRPLNVIGLHLTA